MIRINYTMVMKRVREMQQLSDDVRNISKEIDDIMDEVKSCWKGQAANVYLQKCMELKIKIQQLSGSMSETASSISTVANAIKAADDRIAGIKLHN